MIKSTFICSGMLNLSLEHVQMQLDRPQPMPICCQVIRVSGSAASFLGHSFSGERKVSAQLNSPDNQ